MGREVLLDDSGLLEDHFLLDDGGDVVEHVRSEALHDDAHDLVPALHTTINIGQQGKRE